MTEKQKMDKATYIKELEGNITKLKKQGMNVDGWVNLLAGLSGSSDKTESTYFGDFNVLVDEELTRLWLGEGLGKKIISSVADDMTRNWFTVEGDSDNKIQKELVRIHAEVEVNKALKWARLYRGALIIVGANDGKLLEKPLNLKNIRSIDWLKVYSAPRVPVDGRNIDHDVKSPFFGDVKVFGIQRRNGEILKVHRSRCLIFKGDPLPDLYNTLTVDNEYWGVSILQPIMRNLKDFGSTYQSIANLMMELVIGKYKFNNLAQLLSENNTKAIYTRMEIINASKSLINGVMLGEGEDYTRDSDNVAGIAELIDRIMMLMSAVEGKEAANRAILPLYVDTAPSALPASNERIRYILYLRNLPVTNQADDVLLKRIVKVHFSIFSLRLFQDRKAILL